MDPYLTKKKNSTDMIIDLNIFILHDFFIWTSNVRLFIYQQK